MKKTLALVLALVMVLGLFAGCVKTPADPTDPSTPNNPSNPSNPTDPSTPSTPATYTYNTAMSVFPSLWNPHTYQTATSSDILGYLESGFYTFDYNDNMDGYVMVPLMTTDDHPVDVTADYVGQFGIEEGDKEQVYIINLRQDMVWQDGTPINAHSFVESAKRLLNPKANNYRADGLYSGDVVIYNAENYVKQGKVILVPSDSIHEIYSEDLDSSLVFSLSQPKDGNGEISMRKSMGFPASYDATSCAAYIIGNYLQDSPFNAETAAAMEGKTLAEIKADETLKAAWEALIGWWQTDPNEELDFFLVENAYPELSWDEVGIFAKSDYELVYVIESPVSGFYLKYGLPGGYLVHLETYDACESYVDGIYNNTYMTSAETSMSYGPYKLVEYQTDKVFKFERNDSYFGHGEGLYQTTHINIQFVEKAETRLEMLISGDLDIYGLTANDMDTYSKSDYCYYATGDSTFAMVVNPDMEALKTTQANAGENINKTILTIPEFRMGLSFGLDRSGFCLATSPTNSAAFGLFSSTIISNPDTGVSYRSTQVAKETLAKFWGVDQEYGEGKLYEDIDEAIDSITGYNPTKAKEMFNIAYDKAIEAGLMDSDDVVQIVIGLPSAEAPFYVNGYEYLVNNYTKLVEGTKLEGKLTFVKDDTIGDNFSDSLKNNQTDLLFGVGWTGSALNPYSLIEAYVEPRYQYDDSIDFTAIDLTINLDGVDYTTSVYAWYEIMNGTAHTITAADGTTKEYSCGIADNDPETRLTLLGALEGAVLQNYTFLPIMDDSSAQLKGQKIQYYCEEYIFGLGFGGIKYMTYNYTDAEWAEYVAGENGVLSYN